MAEPDNDTCREILRQAQLGAAMAGAHHHVAEEIAQRVAVNLHTKWGTPHLRMARDKGHSYWISYVRKSAVNAYRDHIRSEGRRVARERRAEFGDQQPPPPRRPGVQRRQEPTPSLLDQFQARAYLVELMKEHLEGRQLEVATRAYIDGLSVNEIAEQLGLKPRTVRDHLQHARDNLRRRLSPETRGDE